MGIFTIPITIKGKCYWLYINLIISIHTFTVQVHEKIQSIDISPILLFSHFVTRLGPRVKKIKNGYPESSKDSYIINLKKYIWCIRNRCIESFSELHNATRANKVW